MLRKLMWRLGFRRVRSWYEDQYGLVYENWMWMYGPRTERKDYYDEREFYIAVNEAKMNKPIGTVVGWYGGHPVIEPIDGWIPAVGTVLNTAPPTRKPLTDEQISAIMQSMATYTWDAHMLARAIERAHGIGGE